MHFSMHIMHFNPSQKEKGSNHKKTFSTFVVQSSIHYTTEDLWKIMGGKSYQPIIIGQILWWLKMDILSIKMHFMGIFDISRWYQP